MWSLWTFRNKRRHGEAILPVRKAVEWIKDTAFDLWHIRHPNKPRKQPMQQPLWKPPAEQWVKCNMDGSFFEQAGQGGTGVMLRDHMGAFQGAQSLWHEHCIDALMMEAFACKEGLEFARQCGVQRVHLETDCLELVRLCEMEGVQRSMIMPVLHEVKELSSSFQGFIISHVSRGCNRIAHDVAMQVFGEMRREV